MLERGQERSLLSLQVEDTERALSLEQQNVSLDKEKSSQT